ncbi:MAG TPA: hypothetical protein VGK37_12325 [Casimicrobiaceae bacterium]|jgi:hypothetical protein
MNAPPTLLVAPESVPEQSSASIADPISAPVRLHTPGPIPPIEDEDDDDEDRGGGSGGGNIDPDDDEDLDDEEDEDDEADKQWARSEMVGARRLFVL